ncbi:MAG: signal peptidase I [Patescibacteria group bacterium]|nr:signal peptidase I [Patescibacteria group bacterium]MDD5554167.1 signal peptidase I [Patescibacteria group bacterium]
MFLFFILFISSYIFFSYKKIKTNQAPDISGCFQKEEKIIQGDSMAPMIANGEEIILLENYYKCGYSVKRGDVIAYNYGGHKNPLIKIVRATSADKVEIFGGRLKINDEIMENSTGQEYTFAEKEIKIMDLYIKDGHIPPNSFLIFGDNIGDSADSRKFGAVSANDFVGKFVAP